MSETNKVPPVASTAGGLGQPPVTNGDPLADALKAKVELKAKQDALKAKARLAAIEAKKALDEAEAVIYADWGPGKPGTKTFYIPPANFVSGSNVSLNGKEMVGNKELTFDTYMGIKHSLSNRAAQEEFAQKGVKGLYLQNVNDGTIRHVDSWDPRKENLLEYDSGKGRV